MNEKEAREIIALAAEECPCEEWSENIFDKNCHACGKADRMAAIERKSKTGLLFDTLQSMAMGYVKAMEKAEGLVKVLRWINEYKHSRFDTEITESLAKWEKER